MQASSDQTVGVDDALRAIKPKGKWQIGTFGAFCIGFGLPIAFLQMSIVFIGKCNVYEKICTITINSLNEYEKKYNFIYFIKMHNFTILYSLISADVPSHHCKVPKNKSIYQALPYDSKNKLWNISSCKQYVNFSYNTNKTEDCTNGYEYDSTYDSTIATEVNIC